MSIMGLLEITLALLMVACSGSVTLEYIFTVSSVLLEERVLKPAVLMASLVKRLFITLISFWKAEGWGRFLLEVLIFELDFCSLSALLRVLAVD